MSQVGLRRIGATWRDAEVDREVDPSTPAALRPGRERPRRYRLTWIITDFGTLLSCPSLTTSRTT